MTNLKLLFIGGLAAIGLLLSPALASADPGDGDGLCGWCEEDIFSGVIEHRMSADGVIVGFCHGDDPENCDEDGHNWEEGRCSSHTSCSQTEEEAALLMELINDDASSPNDIVEFLNARTEIVAVDQTSGYATISACHGQSEVSVKLPDSVLRTLM